MPQGAPEHPASLTPGLFAFLAALAIVGGAAFVIGGRMRAAPPTGGSVVVWTGADGARYYIDTGSASFVGSGAARHGAAVAYYVPPLQVDARGIGRRFDLVARMREDRLTIDCAARTVSGSSDWRKRGIGSNGAGAAPESIFVGAGASSGARAAALEYVCRQPAPAAAGIAAH